MIGIHYIYVIIYICYKLYIYRVYIYVFLFIHTLYIKEFLGGGQEEAGQEEGEAQEEAGQEEGEAREVRLPKALAYEGKAGVPLDGCASRSRC